MNQKEINTRFIRDEPEQLDRLVRDSYENSIRLERRNLLLVSSLIIVSSVAGLNPSKTTLIGLQFENLSPAVYYGSLLLINVYFLLAFVVYGLPLYRESVKKRRVMIQQAGSMSYYKPKYSLHFPNLAGNVRYYSWLFLHFYLPITMGAVACLFTGHEIA